MAAAKAVHRAFTVAKSTVIVASPGDRQSGEFIRKAEGMIESLDIRGGSYEWRRETRSYTEAWTTAGFEFKAALCGACDRAAV